MKVYCTTLPTTPVSEKTRPTSVCIDPNTFAEYGVPVYFKPHWDTSHMSSEVLEKELEEFFKNFSVTQDTLLPLGSPRIMLTAAKVLSRKGTFKYLVWGRSTKTYTQYES